VSKSCSANAVRESAHLDEVGDSRNPVEVQPEVLQLVRLAQLEDGPTALPDALQGAQCGHPGAGPRGPRCDARHGDLKV
jgi:hypothetical protein